MKVKNGNRQQQFVGQHAAEHAARDRLQEVEVEEAEMDREEAEGQSDRGQRERHREADQHGDDQAAEHHRRHRLKRNHCVGLSYFASIVDLAPQRGDALDHLGDALQRQHHEAGRNHEFDRPADQAAGIAGHFADRIGLMEERPRQIAEQQAGRDQEEQRADQIEPELAALGEEQIEDFDPDMLVALEGVGRAEHHQDREHVPLQFEPAVRAVAEGVADHGVAGADQAGGQHQEIADVADLFVDLVDSRAECQQWAHRVLPGARHQAAPIVSTGIASPLRADARGRLHEPWLILASDCNDRSPPIALLLSWLRASGAAAYPAGRHEAAAPFQRAMAPSIGKLAN